MTIFAKDMISGWSCQYIVLILFNNNLTLSLEKLSLNNSELFWMDCLWDVEKSLSLRYLIKAIHNKDYSVVKTFRAGG